MLRIHKHFLHAVLLRLQGIETYVGIWVADVYVCNALIADNQVRPSAKPHVAASDVRRQTIRHNLPRVGDNTFLCIHIRAFLIRQNASVIGQSISNLIVGCVFDCECPSVCICCNTLNALCNLIRNGINNVLVSTCIRLYIKRNAILQLQALVRCIVFECIKLTTWIEVCAGPIVGHSELVFTNFPLESNRRTAQIGIIIVCILKFIVSCIFKRICAHIGCGIGVCQIIACHIKQLHITKMLADTIQPLRFSVVDKLHFISVPCAVIEVCVQLVRPLPTDVQCGFVDCIINGNLFAYNNIPDFNKDGGIICIDLCRICTACNDISVRVKSANKYLVVVFTLVVEHNSVHATACAGCCHVTSCKTELSVVVRVCRSVNGYCINCAINIACGVCAIPSSNGETIGIISN